jgi:D,D-heptose 1,7-bisphosphate phosphatase
VKKSIFLDKDGTLIPNIAYYSDPSKISLVDGATEVLKSLSRLGFIFIVVTNQQGIARGIISEHHIKEVEKRLVELFKEAGVILSGFYYCPHDTDGIIASYSITCNCRKPLPGMLYSAAEEHNIDLKNSWMIGDILDDIEAGNRAGCKTILIGIGNETEWVRGNYRTPDFTVNNFSEISEIITANSLIERYIDI